jgi:hypothetical protein
MPLKRLLACGGFAALLVWTTAAAADIVVSPLPVKTGAITTFTAGPDGPDYSWDLDGDGVFGDRIGSPATWAYRTPGLVTIAVRVGDGPPTTQTIAVNGPSAAFVSFPANPVAGQQMNFVYSQGGEEVGDIEWDLNGDLVFGDAVGPVATTTFPVPGTYAVSLRVSNLDTPPARSTSTQLITVAAPPAPVKVSTAAQLRLMTPFPIVRIAGKVDRKGARIKHLSVRAPFGSTVTVRCKGGGCPFRRATRTLASAGRAKAPAKTVTFRRLERHFLRGGASVKVLVSRPGEIGKYTLFRIRRGKPPTRNDSCLQPGSTKPVQCPSL